MLITVKTYTTDVTVQDHMGSDVENGGTYDCRCCKLMFEKLKATRRC